jgi:hypothetical protein
MTTLQQTNDKAKSYLLLLSAQHLRPSILLIRLRWGVSGAMLLQATLHAIDTAPPDLQTAVDSGGINACFEELDNLLLHICALLATARHGGDG